jgi:hypothetical protein
MLLGLPVHDAIRGQPEKRQAHAGGRLEHSCGPILTQSGLRVQDTTFYDSASWSTDRAKTGCEASSQVRPERIHV